MFLINHFRPAEMSPADELSTDNLLHLTMAVDLLSLTAPLSKELSRPDTYVKVVVQIGTSSTCSADYLLVNNVNSLVAEINESLTLPCPLRQDVKGDVEVCVVALY
jgi:hypothetical protein